MSSAYLTSESSSGSYLISKTVGLPGPSHSFTVFAGIRSRSGWRYPGDTRHYFLSPFFRVSVTTGPFVMGKHA
jgi:hypothetical protein